LPTIPKVMPLQTNGYKDKMRKARSEFIDNLTKYFKNKEGENSGNSLLQNFE